MRVSLSFYVILIALALTCAAVTCDLAGDDGGKQLGTARSRFQLPKLFDFARYKQLFKKRYGSFVEELARQKLVLAKAFQSLISMIKYKFKKASHYLGVNQLSDRTPTELDKLRVPVEVISMDSNKGVVPSQTPMQLEDEVPAAQAASLEDIQAVIAEVEQHKNEPGYKEIAEEFERAKGNSRSKRDASKHRSLSVDDLMHAPEVEQESSKLKRRVPSNNPTYEPPMLDSFGLDDQDEPRSNMPSGVIGFISKYSGADYLKNMVSNAAALMSASVDYQEPDMMDIDGEFVDAQDTLEDMVYYDHRESECFFAPRSQGDCGCCYAFAAISLFEWDFCKQTGFLVPFSEQYIVDCGFVQGMGGCKGGVLDGPTRFVAGFGLELRADYPYREKADTCPYDAQTDARTAGYIRYKDPSYKVISSTKVDQVLPNRPILMGVMVPTDFNDYAGGVDDAESCSREVGGHAMLMVGAGREDGKEYYLIRNSYSVSWGEQGYWKLSKEGFKRCLIEDKLVMSTGQFKQSSKPNEIVSNPFYHGNPIKTRYQTYMNVQALGI